MKTKFTNVCGGQMPKAKNGSDRGTCTERPKHHGKHGNETCSGCGIRLTVKTARPSLIRNKRRRSGLCRKCSTSNYQQIRRQLGIPIRKWQQPGKRHTFSCGCTGILPQIGDSNKFAIGNDRNFYCRIRAILNSSRGAAKKKRYRPISPSTPHTTIRELMEKSKCQRCRRPLSWRVLGPGRTPHLHHDHATGKIHGFTHFHCNNGALEQEIERLKKKLSRAYLMIEAFRYQRDLAAA